MLLSWIPRALCILYFELYWMRILRQWPKWEPAPNPAEVFTPSCPCPPSTFSWSVYSGLALTAGRVFNMLHECRAPVAWTCRSLSKMSIYGSAMCDCCRCSCFLFFLQDSLISMSGWGRNEREPPGQEPFSQYCHLVLMNMQCSRKAAV